MDILEQLAAALAERNKTKAVANHNTAQLLTQPGGLFSTAGLERNIISAHVRPMGLGDMLPAFAANIDDPRYGLITGFGASAGAEATYPCDDAPTGYMKTGSLAAQFGRFMRQTSTIEIDTLLHQPRLASTNLQLIGEMLGTGPLSLGIGVDGLMEMVVKSEMVNVGVMFERLLAQKLWDGTPSANTVGGGYKEFPGLDSQIATGQKDAETGNLMASMDSTIIDFGKNAVDGTTPDIVQVLSAVEYYLRNTAMRTGLAPVTWVLVMRPELWAELSAVWPCRYLTDRCSNSAGDNPIVINDDGSVQLRDAMRNGMFIDINGRRYPVVEDDGINELNSTTTTGLGKGEFASSLYFVPLRVRGNFPVTYWEHIDYRQVGTQLSALGAGVRNVPFWTDNGRFLWVYRDNSFCFDLQAKIEPRVILRTPHLAAKVQNIKYAPALHLRSPFPDSPYFKNGGVSLRTVADTTYAVWKSDPA